MTKYLLALAATGVLAAQSLPQIVNKDGHWEFLVDGSPYLALAAQVNNSSAWPAILPKVWPAIADIHANTVEMPVYWEQLEPQPGKFDYSLVDLLVAQSREHHVRLILLWFGTWKNGSTNYEPRWMKQDRQRYFMVRNAEGKTLNSGSPFATATLDADKRAFAALMRHLRQSDAVHTVILVQVENEVGTYGTLRDYGTAANEQFARPVPAALLEKLHVEKTGDWKEVFGDDADEFFHAWSIAKYVNEVAAAGKAQYPLPMTVNAALRDPFHPRRGTYEQGGPTDNVLNIWKASAPAIDAIGPDIYAPDAEHYLKYLDLYSRPDNALLVPENGNRAGYARYFFAALGHDAIGWAPFGIDYTAYSNAPLGAPKVNKESLQQFAINYELVGPMMRQMAELEFEGKVTAAVEQKGQPQEKLAVGDWNATVSYGLGSFGPAQNPPGNPEPIGRVFVAQLGPNEFLAGGFFCRIDFETNRAGAQRQYLSVEEGHYEKGQFVPVRIWNGDQTDWGLNFGSEPVLLRVRLTTY